jgi:signal transduction histidine kinase/FixJ family two-component response regulator
MQRDLLQSLEESPSEVAEESRAQQRIVPEHLDPKHLDPKHLDPEHLDPEHLDPKHLDPKHLDPEHLDPKHLAEQQYTEALERLLAAAFGSSSSNELISKLLELLSSSVPLELGVALLRDGSSLVATASLGLGSSVATELCLPVSEALEGLEPAARAVFTVRDPSRILPGERLGCLLCMPLIHAEEVLGVIYLGTSGSWQPAPAQTGLLSALAVPCAAALAQRVAQEDLQRDVRARDDVLGVVAHDLQNPLNVISMAANMLLTRITEQSARRPIERIVRSVQRATRLLRDLLDVGAIEEGHFAIERRRVDPTALILSALESQQSLAADASVITATDLSPSLPQIDADEERLLEVLENLIGNAIKFTSPGGTISVGALAENEQIKIWVADNGSGIPEQHLPHIFDRFWQAKRGDRRGTGLGLTICKGIVEAHEGQIWAESTPGKGTTLSFTLPAEESPDSRYQATNVANILLVDDRPENLLALKTILDRPDYRLVTADSGDKALRVALREQFAVALIDIAMPGMNGLEVATHLKELERSRDIPIIFVTAFGDDPEEIHRAYAAGGADYLVKPLDAEIVKKKVAVFVDLSRRRLPSDRPPAEAAARR